MINDVLLISFRKNYLIKARRNEVILMAVQVVLEIVEDQFGVKYMIQNRIEKFQF